MKTRLCIISFLLICLFLASCQENAKNDSPDILDVTSVEESYDVSIESEASNDRFEEEEEEEESIANPQAYIEVMREGEANIIPVEIAKGTVGKYTIAYDPEYFVFSSEESVDRFIYESWGDNPSVYYNVTICNTDAEAFISDKKASNGEPYYEFETLIGNYKAKAIYFESDNICLHYYVIDCENAAYVIEAQFVTEMYEGLYAIMQALFDTFTITQ